MTETGAGILGMIVLVGLLALRMPVGLSLLAVGFGGISVLNGMPAGTATMASTAQALSANYLLVIVPLFVLMGNIASVSGMSRSLFDAAFAWIGGLRGGMASAAVVGCAGFSAVSGSSVATALTMGRVALPEMDRVGYSPRLATGAVAAGGTLGILIPPSAGFVIYALLTEASIGRLFMAGIVPGLLLTLLFVATISLNVRLNPEIAPRALAIPWSERWRTLGGALPLVFVVCVSIGGIYLGVFTPTEAAGVGAFLITVIAFAMGRLTLRTFGPALLDSVRTTAAVFLIAIGASVLGPFLALTHLPSDLLNLLVEAGFGPYTTLLLILACYILLGTFLEAFSMLVITVPVFLPIVAGYGFDLVWFGVLIVVVVEMGLITPPVGLNVFVVKTVAERTPMSEIFIGVMPFWVAMVVGLALLVAFPQLSLFLPDSMFR
ncbi:TRAP transporter large permease [Nitratireductor sp. XY-223]|uniref:TRAP transporter large permease n=1 Tax=Nitratireductor sp. XY-223 TaxID=2561926 RepID=UPI0010AAF2FA|nr:TRAP transporter large permease [Nitratireductor sp. XY-223]